MRRAIVAGLAAAAISGCGGTTLSLHDLRTQASAICQTAARRTGRIPTPAGPAGTLRFLTVGSGVLSGELASLRTLTPGAPQASAYRTATGALESSIELVRRARAAIVHGSDPATALRALQSRLTPVETLGDGAWRSLGIPVCVSR